MSLRYKALALVLVLVTAVTGGLLLVVQSKVETSTVEDIHEDLAVDGLRLKEKLTSGAEAARSAVRSSLKVWSVGDIVRRPEGIKDNFDQQLLDWVKQSRADYGVAALDTVLAEGGKAPALHREKDWWIVAARGEVDDPRVTQRLADAPAVNALVRHALSEMRTVVRVIPVEPGLCLAVAVPFFEELSAFQKFADLEGLMDRHPGAAADAAMKKFREEYFAAGVAVMLTELNGDWVRRNRIRGPAALPDDRPEAGYARRNNDIFQVLFDGDAVAATNVDDPAVSKDALRAARSGGSPLFQVPLVVAGRRETYVGLALNFADGPFSWDLPGFIALKSFDREIAPFRSLFRQVLVFGALFAVLGALAAYGASWLVIRRLRALQAATERVRGGDFQVAVPVDSRDEVGVLAGAFNNMIKGLQALGLYTDSVLARSVLDNPELLGGKASRHEGTILFTDIRNFTGITESMDAGALTAQLNEYFGAIGEHVKKEGGYLDKFIGDAVMAFWGPPFLSTPDHAARACRAALLCTRATADLRRSWQQQGKPLFFQRIGLATGEVVVGNIGSAAKKNFTVIGDSVNLASRLEGASKVYGTEILLDERTAELAGSAVLVREVDEIVVRGKQKPVRVFELLGLTSETSTVARRLMEAYGRALAAYRAGDYAAARSSLEAALQAAPGDGPSQWLAGRCAEAMSGKAVPAPLTITKSYGPAET